MSQTMSLEQLLAIEHRLSEEERIIRDTVRAWVRERYLPLLVESHRTGIFPQQLIPEMGELGLFGGSIQGYGCAGMNNVAYGLTLFELERGDSGLRSVCSVQGSLAMHAILAFGNEEQRSRYLPEMAAGRMIGCFGLTEPSAGSDPASMRTTATKDGDIYVLDGVKAWITSSPIAHLAVVWAKDTSDDGRIRGFIVEREHGMQTPEVEGKLSLRASPTGDIVLNEVRVPAGNLLPDSSGIKSPLSCLTQARYGIGWGVMGAATDCFDTVLQYGLDRIQFDKPIASLQLYQAKLAEMATQIVSGTLLALHCGRLKDRSWLTPAQVSLLKRNNLRIARDAARTAREMLGANGITDAYSVMRHMMNIESVFTYEGTDDVHTLALGQALTGLSAFR